MANHLIHVGQVKHHFICTWNWGHLNQDVLQCSVDWKIKNKNESIETLTVLVLFLFFPWAYAKYPRPLKRELIHDAMAELMRKLANDVTDKKIMFQCIRLWLGQHWIFGSSFFFKFVSSIEQLTAKFNLKIHIYWIKLNRCFYFIEISLFNVSIYRY